MPIQDVFIWWTYLDIHSNKFTVVSNDVGAHFKQEFFSLIINLAIQPFETAFMLWVDLTSESSAHLKDALFSTAVFMPTGKQPSNYIVFVKLWLRHVCDEKMSPDRQSAEQEMVN